MIVFNREAQTNAKGKRKGGNGNTFHRGEEAGLTIRTSLYEGVATWRGGGKKENPHLGGGRQAEVDRNESTKRGGGERRTYCGERYFLARS